VTSEDATALFHLRCLWQEAYAINLTSGIWTAQRCANPTQILTAGTALDLRWRIQNDYGEWLRTRA
jgi:hypothetical protein